METAGAVEQLNHLLADRYVVEREIGHGGMATVYLAQDIRHRRKVALKLLLAELGAILGPERFLSEIRVTANLQHPNLLPLFDSGEAGGRLYYVMPYVQGESLRHRLNREKQIPVDEAVRIATACASALDYAHRNDVIHRDLKPENILMSAGQPVIADFGIALAVSNAGGARITQSGLSLGTPQYMSPEQAAGDRDIDGRSDIYSLACVLYELLTGDPPHTGSTVQAIVAKVLVEKPRSVRAQRDRIPEHVDAAIERALAKIPADRWATAGQFAEALNDPAMTSASRARVTDSGISQREQRSKPLAVLRRAFWPTIAVVATAAAVFAFERLRSVPPPKTVSFVVSTPETAPLAVLPSFVVFVPDGQSIIYAANVAGKRQLYMRQLSELEPRAISGTENAYLPIISPDGKWVAFAVEGDLYRVPVTGGTPTRITQATKLRGASWNQSGAIVYGTDAGGLYLTSANGDTPRRLTTPDSTKGELSHIQPMFLPDGKTIVFRIEDRETRTNDRLAITSLDGNAYQSLGVSGGNPLAMFDGTLFFGRPGGFIASVPFDVKRKKALAEPTVLLDQVSVFAGAAASFAADGSLAYIKSTNLSRLIITNNPATPDTTTGGELRRYTRPNLSPDSRKIAVEISSRGKNRSDIWVYDIASGVVSRVTSQATSHQPVWTPDGKSIVYIREDGARTELWRVPADGSGPETRFFAPEESVRDITFSPNGRLAAFRTDDPQTRRDIWLLSIDSTGAPGRAVPFLRTGFNEGGARISPNGNLIAYVSDESGRNEVYVRPFPGNGPREQISASGGVQPVWVSDSRIVYRSAGRFIAATLSNGPEISVTRREEPFQGRYRSSGLDAEYDADRKGKFVLLEPAGGDELVVMLNAASKFLREGARN
ncbi:MAG TPA: protein kinase [Gemmatimonadaceae bacterium]|nr:protein kinase [Gemmatimonadaceae bacterium]